MKKTSLLLFCILLFPLQNVFASNCDLHRFRWDCVIELHPNKTTHAQTLVYCGNSFGFVSEADYATIERYQRVSVNLVLKFNDEYIDSPCIAAHAGHR